MVAKISLVGNRFGRLLVVREEPPIITGGRSKTNYRVRCDCGAETTVVGDNLRSGHTRSCGCLHQENTETANLKHGATSKGRAPEYHIWATMIQRCTNPNSERYPRYGARGIMVCDRWRFGEEGRTGFECFIQDVGWRPAPDLSIDRIDNDGNYEPSNCRWATRSEQQRNK